MGRLADQMELERESTLKAKHDMSLADRLAGLEREQHVQGERITRLVDIVDRLTNIITHRGIK